MRDGQSSSLDVGCLFPAAASVMHQSGLCRVLTDGVFYAAMLLLHLLCVLMMMIVSCVIWHARFPSLGMLS